MGSFLGSCHITGLAIDSGTEVIAFPLLQVYDGYQLTMVPIHGKYVDSGSIDEEILTPVNRSMFDQFNNKKAMNIVEAQDKNPAIPLTQPFKSWGELLEYSYRDKVAFKNLLPKGTHRLDFVMVRKDAMEWVTDFLSKDSMWGSPTPVQEFEVLWEHFEEDMEYCKKLDRIEFLKQRSSKFSRNFKKMKGKRYCDDIQYFTTLVYSTETLELACEVEGYAEALKASLKEIYMLVQYSSIYLRRGLRPMTNRGSQTENYKAAAEMAKFVGDLATKLEKEYQEEWGEDDS